MGRVGFLYESVKDQLRWSKLSVKKYTKLISDVGKILSLSDEEYSKSKAKALKMSNEDLTSSIFGAFGDGK